MCTDFLFLQKPQNPFSVYSADIISYLYWNSRIQPAKYLTFRHFFYTRDDQMAKYVVLHMWP